ncbi:MAG: 2-amino-4-hydroxy-6-hydroxymethyldihydropteridine diphosphokinase [Acidimicrobiales bacterium]
MTVAVLALGSNLGDRFAHLQAGVAALAERLPLRAVSSVYETEPVGGPEQACYLNAVVLAEVGPGIDLLELAQRVEAAQGRQRRERWGPRTLDVDVIAVGGSRSDNPALTLPHPRAHERAFVLVPWAEADPAAVLPGYGRVTDVLVGLDQHGVRRRTDLALPGHR